MLWVNDTSTAHSDIDKELRMEKYRSERILTAWKQEDTKRTRKKSDILVDNWKEGIQTSQGINCQGHGILVLVAGIPNYPDCTVGKSPRIDPGGYPHQV